MCEICGKIVPVIKHVHLVRNDRIDCDGILFEFAGPGNKAVLYDITQGVWVNHKDNEKYNLQYLIGYAVGIFEQHSYEELKMFVKEYLDNNLD